MSTANCTFILCFSRAHTVVELTLTQKIKTGGANMTKTSVVNLVDLAGRYVITLKVCYYFEQTCTVPDFTDKHPFIVYDYNASAVNHKQITMTGISRNAEQLLQ